jgi:hypothetical protein
MEMLSGTANLDMVLTRSIVSMNAPLPRWFLNFEGVTHLVTLRGSGTGYWAATPAGLAACSDRKEKYAWNNC